MIFYHFTAWSHQCGWDSLCLLPSLSFRSCLPEGSIPIAILISGRELSVQPCRPQTYWVQRGPADMHSRRSSENIHVTMPLKLSPYYYELRPRSVRCLWFCQGGWKNKRAAVCRARTVKYWARRWYALSPSSRFTTSFEWWNKISVRSIDFWSQTDCPGSDSSSAAYQLCEPD